MHILVHYENAPMHFHSEQEYVFVKALFIYKICLVNNISEKFINLALHVFPYTNFYRFFAYMYRTQYQAISASHFPTLNQK